MSVSIDSFKKNLIITKGLPLQLLTGESPVVMDVPTGSEFYTGTVFGAWLDDVYFGVSSTDDISLGIVQPAIVIKDNVIIQNDLLGSTPTNDKRSPWLYALGGFILAKATTKEGK